MSKKANEKAFLDKKKAKKGENDNHPLAQKSYENPNPSFHL